MPFFRTFLTSVAGWPTWGKIVATIGIVASVAGIIGFGIQLSAIFFEWEQKRDKFDTAYQRVWDGMDSQFMSSHNFLLNVIPNNIYQTTDPQHWMRVSYSWNKHMEHIETFYAELARCLEEEECLPGKKKDRVCGHAKAEFQAHQSILTKVKNISGINIDFTGGNSPFGNVFGPSVSVPTGRNLEIVVERACS